jgi:hypothetical protein
VVPFQKPSTSKLIPKILHHHMSTRKSGVSSSASFRLPSTMSRTISSRTKTHMRTQYERPGRKTIVEKIDGMEGDDISDSDLDIINVVTKEVDAGNTDKYIKGLDILF